MISFSRCFPDPSGHKEVIRSEYNAENEADLSDRNISSLGEVSRVLSANTLTRLTLSHNRIKSLPDNIGNLANLEILNLFNNVLVEVPPAIASLSKLKVLNLGMNRLNSLPLGFGSFNSLEVLDLSYNNLNERSLPPNFFMLETLRALYLGDNDFEYMSPEIGKLKNLQVLVLRDNDLVALPKEMGLLSRLRELHIQGNRLAVLPPELGSLDLGSQRCVVRMEKNPWVPPIQDQLSLGISHVMDYIRSDTYKFIFGRHIQVLMTPEAAPNRNNEKKSKKISRIRT